MTTQCCAWQESPPRSTVRTLATRGATELDPIGTLGLILVVGRPDRMGIPTELTP